jgi:aldehyde dehydrogenase (NAD+)
MYEQWHSLGVVGVISAFNFPVAVWSWNAFIAAVCGDCVIWKPSLKTPLCAIAVQKICDRVLERHGWRGVFSLIVGEDAVIGKKVIEDRRIPLVSATGSCRMGRAVAETVARRLGRTLLELGGNNGVIVMNDANPDLAVRAVLFGAAGTAGQRCTSIRRLFLQRGIADQLTAKLQAAYAQIRVGNPLEESTLMGPLIDRAAVDAMQAALARIRTEGGAGGRACLNGRLFEESPSRHARRHWELRIALAGSDYVNFFQDFGAETDPLILSQFVNAVERGVSAWLAAQPAEPIRMPATPRYYSAAAGPASKSRAV